MIVRTQLGPAAFPLSSLLLLALVACEGTDRPDGDGAQPPAAADGAVESAPRLGPHDGRDLPPADLDRVAVGDPAPDFTLASLRGGPVTLSDFRGSKDVVLVFYRGHW